MDQVLQITETQLESLLIRAAKLGAAEFRRELAENEVMDKNECAKHIKKSPATVNRYMAAGMPYSGQGQPRFYKSEVDEWLKSR